MANTYKNIVITPYSGSANSDPTIQFSGGNTSSNTDVYLRVYPDSNGTLSFEGSAGQLFSITNDLTGSIFSVNDVSGIPLIDVNVTSQLISIAPNYGNVSIGSSNANNKLTVGGNVLAQFFYGNGAFLTGISAGGGGSGSGVVNNTLTFTNSSIFSNTVVTNSNTSQILDVFSTSTWRSANYIITMNTTPSLFHTTQIALLHDGTTAYITEYGTVFTSNNLAIFDATIVSGNVRLNVVPSVAVTTINFVRTTNK